MLRATAIAAAAAGRPRHCHWALTAAPAPDVRRRCLHASGIARNRSCGLVGLPNVGKSTLFNALVRQQLALTANYPFATISPNIANATIPDARLDALARLSGTNRTIYQTLEVHDIAGLIEGASKGEGLGNAFLQDIRNTACILHVLRTYEDPDIVHVFSKVDPIHDLLVIENELLLADLQSLEKRLSGKGGRGQTAEAVAQAKLMQAARQLLEDGLPARAFDTRSLMPSERRIWEQLGLLTQKPVLYCLNTSEEHAATGNELTAVVTQYLGERHAAGTHGRGSGGGPAAADPNVVIVCGKLEQDLSELPNEERAEFLRSFGLAQSGMDAVLQRCAPLLQLQVYYTTGKEETRAWAIPVGATAPEAAGVIHTDFEKGFIKASVTSYNDFIACGGEKQAKEQGKMRLEGRDYVMVEGDVVEFHFKVAR